MEITTDVRLAVLEEKVKAVDTKVSDVATNVKEIKKLLEDYPIMKQDISELKSSGNLWKWLSPTLTAILTAVMTWLVINYITKL